MRYEQFSVALPQAAAVMRALPLLVLSIVWIDSATTATWADRAAVDL